MAIGVGHRYSLILWRSPSRARTAARTVIRGMARPRPLRSELATAAECMKRCWASAMPVSRPLLSWSEIALAFGAAWIAGPSAPPFSRLSTWFAVASVGGEPGSEPGGEAAGLKLVHHGREVLRIGHVGAAVDQGQAQIALRTGQQDVRGRQQLDRIRATALRGGERVLLADHGDYGPGRDRDESHGRQHHRDVENPPGDPSLDRAAPAAAGRALPRSRR